MAKLIDITGKVVSGEWGTTDESGDGIPVLRTTNFTNEGAIDFCDVITRTIIKKNIDEKYLRQGDIIIEKSGGSDKQPVGRVVYFNGPEKTYLFNNFTGLLRVKDQKNWYPKYVFYSLYFNYLRGGTRVFESKTTGLHNLRINDFVSRYEVPETNIAEQKKICELLDRLSNIVRKRKQELQMMDELIKARFVEMFGDPILNTHSLQTVELQQLGSWGSGGTPSRKNNEYFKGNIDWYSAGELNSQYLKKSKEKITQQAIENSATQLLPSGSLLVGMYDTAAFKMGVLTKESSCNQACAFLIPNYSVNVVWLYHELSLMKPYFLQQRHGVRQNNLNLGMIKKFMVPIVDINDQNVFVNFVQQVDKSKAAIQKSIDETQLLYDSLMQKYFG